MVYTKIVSLIKFYNFVVKGSFDLKSFRVPNICSWFIDFKIQYLEFVNDLNVHIVNTKVLVADLIYILSVDKFFVWSRLVSQRFVLNSHHFRFNLLNFQIISDGETSYTKVIVLGNI